MSPVPIKTTSPVQSARANKRCRGGRGKARKATQITTPVVSPPETESNYDEWFRLRAVVRNLERNAGKARIVQMETIEVLQRLKDAEREAGLPVSQKTYEEAKEVMCDIVERTHNLYLSAVEKANAYRREKCLEDSGDVIPFDFKTIRLW